MEEEGGAAKVDVDNAGTGFGNSNLNEDSGSAGKKTLKAKSSLEEFLSIGSLEGESITP